MQLTKDFTLEELTRTDTGVVNIPGEAEKEKLLCLATYILQPIRERWGGLIVTSGFRCPALNAQVGGVAASQHVKGEAADFIAHDASLDDVFKWIVNGSGSRFGQCIRES
ncbi:MAG: hypothetical protein HY894_07965, partial [Deltaproteobacteria bacterium]|nr:hypothetical protein [Deltaproteobacteria bacterium]